jgi:hypothetical protein
LAQIEFILEQQQIIKFFGNLLGALKINAFDRSIKNDFRLFNSARRHFLAWGGH